MKLLTTLGKGQGYLKAGMLGFQGSGKTYTACLLGVATRRAFKLDGPVAFIDTENATEYIAPMVRELTGQDLVGVRTRDFNSLCDATQECVDGGISCLVVDSMTHFWRSICDSYLAGLNETRRRYNKPPRMKLEFQDWGVVKGQWARWTDLYLNSKLHIIICGRAGFEYDMEKNEDTGRTELIKTGVKMKTEAEFGFEPSLLVQMAVDQEPDEKRPGKFLQVRTATVLKDRFAKIDAQTFTFAGQHDAAKEMERVWTAFGPHVSMLTPGAHSTVETKSAPMEVSEDGDVEWAREKKARTILAEEIQGVLVSAIPGMGAEDKKRKADLFQQVFGSRSWTAVESMPSDKLRAGLAALRKAVGDKPAPASEPQDDVPMNYPPPPSKPLPPPPTTPTKPVEASPAPPQSEPERKVQSQAPEVPASGEDELVAIIGDANLPAAVTWMIRNNWLTSADAMADNPFAVLKPEHRAKVKGRPAAFIRAITGGAK